MTFQDKTMTCIDCQAEFVHSADDQQRYSERGFTNEPKRCPTCRERRKTSGDAGGGGGRSHGGRGGGGYGGGGGGGSREMYDITCAGCGKPTQVPFKPTGSRPVYCRDCFQAHKR